MSEFKPKRLITHKELEKAVEIRSNGVSEQIPLHRVVIYVYYLKGGSPLETGNTAYAILNREGYLYRVNTNREIVWTVNVGEWLENVLSKGVTARKPNNISKEDWLEAVWTGDLDVLPVPQLRLTQEQKKEVKKVLYSQINHNGSLALYEEEERLKSRSDEEKERAERQKLLREIGSNITDIDNSLYGLVGFSQVDEEYDNAEPSLHLTVDFNTELPIEALRILRDETRNVNRNIDKLYDL